MTDQRLIDGLAVGVMGWTVAPDRFLMGRRRWIPRWRFQPTRILDDAFKLLEKAAPQDYAMGDDGRGFWVRVRIGKVIGQARDRSKARAIVIALARALGLEPAGCKPAKAEVEQR
jgi:hypothetical protein